MRNRAMRNTARCLLIASFISAIGFLAIGCTHTIDGSQEFSNQMPQYNYNDDNPTPAYMHPADGGVAP